MADESPPVKGIHIMPNQVITIIFGLVVIIGGWAWTLSMDRASSESDLAAELKLVNFRLSEVEKKIAKMESLQQEQLKATEAQKKEDQQWREKTSEIVTRMQAVQRSQ